MEILSAIFSLLWAILGVLWSIIWWFLSFLLMPFLMLLLIAAIALRYAYRSPYFKPFIDRQFTRLGNKGLDWLRNLLYMISVQPVRVLLRFMWFSTLYAFINLLWRPRWSPWQRAKERPQPKKQVHTKS